MNDVSNLPDIDLNEIPKMKGKTPSKYQMDLFKAIKHGRGNYVVQAVAGSGKSTTIEAAFDLIPEYDQRETRFTAFNKHIQTELEQRGLPAKTIHAEGFASWCKLLCTQRAT